MLDVAGLPKNINGFRTTHTCELCGFEPKTKNKYREKQDHLVMKHFKDRIDKIFPHCRPYACPAGGCPFTGKDKQALLRHYTGKHGILERYLREALAEKGITYLPGEGGKRRHSDSSNSSTGSTGVGRGGKNPRLSLTPPSQQQQQQQTVVQVGPDGQLTPVLEQPQQVQTVQQVQQQQQQQVATKQVTLPTKPTNAEELRKEVEAMMRSFQPVMDQPVAVLQIPSSAVISSVGNGNSNGIVSTAGGVTVSLPTTPVTNVCSSSSTALPNGLPSGAVVTAIPVIQSTNAGNGTVVATAASTATVVPVASLPAIVLSAVANATAASVAANNGTSNGGTVGVGGLPPVTVSLPTQPSDVPTITVSNGGNKSNALSSAPVASLLANGPSASSLPLPIEAINGGQRVTLNGKLNGAVNHQLVLTSGTEGTTSPSPVNDDVMWSAVNSAPGPAVVVEAANTVPVAYVQDASSSATAQTPAAVVAANGAEFVNINGGAISVNGATNGGTVIVNGGASNGGSTIESIDYDYLYSVAAAPSSSAGANGGVNGVAVAVDARERQLDFCML